MRFAIGILLILVAVSSAHEDDDGSYNPDPAFPHGDDTFAGSPSQDPAFHNFQTGGAHSSSSSKTEDIEQVSEGLGDADDMGGSAAVKFAARADLPPIQSDAAVDPMLDAIRDYDEQTMIKPDTTPGHHLLDALEDINEEITSNKKKKKKKKVALTLKKAKKSVKKARKGLKKQKKMVEHWYQSENARETDDKKVGKKGVERWVEKALPPWCSDGPCQVHLVHKHVAQHGKKKHFQHLFKGHFSKKKGQQAKKPPSPHLGKLQKKKEEEKKKVAKKKKHGKK